MGTAMYAFAEMFDGDEWRLCLPLEFDEDFEEECPVNAWPYWGRENSRWYCEVSGYRGIPDDIDKRLSQYIRKHWTEEAFGDDAIAASWMTYDEILHQYELDVDGSYSHFPERCFGDHKTTPHSHLRITFWVDQ